MRLRCLTGPDPPRGSRGRSSGRRAPFSTEPMDAAQSLSQCAASASVMSILVRPLETAGAVISLSEGHQFKSGFVSLEPGGEVGEHRTGDGEELIIFMSGNAEVVCGSEKERVRAPSAVLIPAHTLHNVRNESESLLKYVYVVAAGRPMESGKTESD